MSKKSKVKVVKYEMIGSYLVELFEQETKVTFVNPEKVTARKIEMTQPVIHRAHSIALAEIRSEQKAERLGLEEAERLVEQEKEEANAA